MGDCRSCQRIPRIRHHWCQNCTSKRFQRNFDKWTSGNKRIDKFIQEVQLKAKNHYEVIEWIPHNKLRNIEYLARGGFSTVYKAIWSDGRIVEWDNREQNWKRDVRFLYSNENDYKEKEKQGIYVVLKSLNNSSNINDDFLNEVRKFLITSILQIKLLYLVDLNFY